MNKVKQNIQLKDKKKFDNTNILLKLGLPAIIINTSNKIVEINKHFEMLTRFTSQEILNKPYNFVINQIPKTKQNKTTILQKKDGSKIPIHIHLVNLNKAKESKTLILITECERYEKNNMKILQRSKELEEMHRTLLEMSKALEISNTELKNTNVSLEKAVERATQMALEAASANAVKSKFLANVSHEIRTPLNGIIGTLALLSETPLTTEQSNYIKMAKESADNLLNIINTILDFSKIESDKIEIENVEFNLWELISKVSKQIAINAYAKSLQFIVNMSPNLPEHTIGDPGKLRQILINVLDNAVKFTKNGRVELKVETIKEKSDFEKNMFILQCIVTDTGIGIPTKYLDSIFEPFSQADVNIQSKFGGTGLGLTISRRLARIMGGNITVESSEGKGSSFKITCKIKTTNNPITLSSIAEKIKETTIALIINDQISREKLTESLISLNLTISSYKSLLHFSSAKKNPHYLLIDDETLFFSDENIIKNTLQNITSHVILAEMPSTFLIDRMLIGRPFSAILLKPIIEYELLEE